MKVVVAAHDSGLTHDTGLSHPERPARVNAVREGLARSGQTIVEIEAPAASRADLALVHDADYIARVEEFSLAGGGALDMDTIVSPSSWEAALHAAGGVIAVVEALREGTADLGVAITRPPGHHALPARAMGFCLFNNVAVTAARLRSDGYQVAILDWDVHHGNGTQAMLGSDPGVLYVSLHQSPFYPFEGEAGDIESDEKGTTINVPLPAGTAGDVYRSAWDRIVLPIVDQFHPDWVLISAGYDAHIDDPLADLRLTAADYGWLAGSLGRIHPTSRTVVALEGGYNLAALRDSTNATIRGFAGEVPAEPALHSPESSAAAVEIAAHAAGSHWSL